MNRINNTSIVTASAVAAALALGACQRNEAEPTAGERVDSAMAEAKDKAVELKDDIKRGANEAAKDLSQAAETAGVKVKDATITTAINAELARDADLSARKIDVDTTEGRVVLRGTAPNDAARSRAESLANSVSGVMAVDNQLRVEAQT